MRPLDSICFFHLFDSYRAVMTVNRSTGSFSPAADGASGTCVNVHRPNAQFRMYRPLPVAVVDVAISLSEDSGVADAYSTPLMRYTSSFVGCSSSFASL